MLMAAMSWVDRLWTCTEDGVDPVRRHRSGLGLVVIAPIWAFKA